MTFISKCGFLINKPFATLHSHPSFQRATSHIYVEVSHLNCDTSIVERTSIHLSQGPGSFDRLTNGFNSHEFSVDLNHCNWIAKPDFPAQVLIVEA
jgi:hypothetical protein